MNTAADDAKIAKIAKIGPLHRTASRSVDPRSGGDPGGGDRSVWRRGQKRYLST